MIDITERLRGMAARDDISALTSWTIEEAADEIERLRAALREIAGYSAVNGMTRVRMRSIAATALRGQG